MTRHALMWSVALIVGATTGFGCLRPNDAVGPVARRAPIPKTEPQRARAPATASYHPFPPPSVQPPPDVRSSLVEIPEPSRADREVDTPSIPKMSGPEATVSEPSWFGPGTVFPVAKPEAKHPLVSALQCRLDKRPDDAKRMLEDYEPETQKFLLGLLGLATRFSDSNPSMCSTPCPGELIDEFAALLQPLRCRAPLKIEKICFCNRIKTFGVYEPLAERAQLRPDDQVHIYVELRNFETTERKQSNGEVRHVINLRSSYEIHDENSKPVHEAVFRRDRDAADESRTPRNDYFENYVFTVPKLKAGMYTLWIKIDDLGTDPARTVKASLDFQVPSSPLQVTRGPN